MSPERGVFSRWPLQPAADGVWVCGVTWRHHVRQRQQPQQQRRGLPHLPRFRASYGPSCVCPESATGTCICWRPDAHAVRREGGPAAAAAAAVGAAAVPEAGSPRGVLVHGWGKARGRICGRGALIEGAQPTVISAVHRTSSWALAGPLGGHCCGQFCEGRITTGGDVQRRVVLCGQWHACSLTQDRAHRHAALLAGCWKPSSFRPAMHHIFDSLVAVAGLNSAIRGCGVARLLRTAGNYSYARPRLVCCPPVTRASYERLLNCSVRLQAGAGDLKSLTTKAVVLTTCVLYVWDGGAIAPAL